LHCNLKKYITTEAYVTTKIWHVFHQLNTWRTSCDF